MKYPIEGDTYHHNKQWLKGISYLDLEVHGDCLIMVHLEYIEFIGPGKDLLYLNVDQKDMIDQAKEKLHSIGVPCP